RDTDDVVRNPGRLDTLAGVRPFAHMAVLVADAAMRVVDVARPLARHNLVRLASLAIEMEDELEGRRQATVPIARKPRALVPDVEAEPAPARLAQPAEPVVP